MIPFAHDQPDNAHRVKNLGCGEIVFAKKLSVERLVKAINEVTGNKEYSIAAEKYREGLLGSDFEREFLKAIDAVIA
jgi:UDP:flavonoid glycosyltransferase YjiC (YdhE family)